MIGFYHGSDLDGYCSGAIVRYKFPECRMIPLEYGSPFPWDQIRGGETVYMCDYSLPRDEMIRLLELTECNFHWYDHHDTAIKALHDVLHLFPNGLRDKAYSGCELTWKGLFPNDIMPDAVFLLGRYDVWDHRDPRVVPFQYRMQLEDLDPSDPDSTHRWRELFENFPLDRYVQEGQLIHQYQVAKDYEYIKSYGFDTILYAPKTGLFNRILRFFRMGGYASFPSAAVNKGYASSDIFNGFFDSSKHILKIVFSRTTDQKWRATLYSPDECPYHCGQIAKAIAGDKGGGHQHAAGFIVDKLPFDF